MLGAAEFSARRASCRLVAGPTTAGRGRPARATLSEPEEVVCCVTLRSDEGEGDSREGPVPDLRREGPQAAGSLHLHQHYER
eukprot:10749061-Heterocapsa_arctica.AAC.1